MTLDSIRNSCDVYLIGVIFPGGHHGNLLACGQEGGGEGGLENGQWVGMVVGGCVVCLCFRIGICSFLSYFFVLFKVKLDDTERAGGKEKAGQIVNMTGRVSNNKETLAWLPNLFSTFQHNLCWKVENIFQRGRIRRRRGKRGGGGKGEVTSEEEEEREVTYQSRRKRGGEEKKKRKIV